MSKAIRFVSETVMKITDLVGEGKMTVEAAHELLDVMKANGFAEKHDTFFEAMKRLVQKVADSKDSE